MWLGDVNISQAEALNPGSYGVYLIFVSEVKAEYVKNLKLFLNKSILYLLQICLRQFFAYLPLPWKFLLFLPRIK